MRLRFRFRRTSVMMVGLTCLLVGLGLSRKLPVIHEVWIIVTALFLAVAITKAKGFVIIAAALFGLTVGWWRGAHFLQTLTPYQHLYRQTVTLRGIASSDGIYENGQLSFDVGQIKIAHPEEVIVPGEVGVQALGLPAVFRGDSVEVRGKLFPTRGSRQGRISYAEARILQPGKSWIETFRRKFIAGMQTALPEPHASFGLGILIGQRSTLPDDLTDQLSIVGLTHIIAVSGYNLTILVRFAHNKLGQRSKYQIFVLSVVLIVLFLLLTDFSASIVRAAIVSLLGLGAWYYGRQIRPLLILLLSGAVTAAWYPVYVWSDIGWYLSFLAFFGVLILAPLLTKRFWKKEPWGIMPIVIESGCAQIMTAPLVMYIFNETSLIALPSNMLIVPMVPLAMMFVFIAGLAGMLLSRLAGFIAWPAQLVLTYMLEIIELLARVPNALIEQTLSLPFLLLSYALVIGLCWLLWMKTKPKYDTLTDINLEKKA